MNTSGIESPLGRKAAWFAGAVALIMAVSTGSQAAARQVKASKTYAAAVQDGVAQEQKPVRLRYFGGPKSAMFAE